MRHYFLIVALGEIFYGVVLAQNSNNYGPNTDYGNFPQNNPSQNWNGRPNQGGFQQDGYQPRGVGPPRRRKFRQRPPDPQPPPFVNNYDYPSDQPPNQGYDNNWNPPPGGNDNTPYNANYDDTGQTDNFQGNNAPQPNYDQISGPDTDDDVTTTTSSTSGKKKKRKRRKRPPGSPPLRKRRRRRKDPKDRQQVDNSDGNSNDGSSNNDDDVPSGLPNDYPGYTYPPEFFSDLLGGLDDSTSNTGSSDTQDEDTEGGGGSSDDLVPEDIPNDYPGFSYPPDFFTELFEGLENSTNPSDSDDDVTTESNQGDTRTIETTTITKTTTRKRKKRPPGSKRRRRRPRGKSRTSTTPGDNDDRGQGSDDQSGDGDGDDTNSYPTRMMASQDYTSSYDDSGNTNATDFLDYMFSGVDNSSDVNSPNGNGGKEKDSSGLNIDDFLKEFKDRLKNRNRTNHNRNPSNNDNTSNTNNKNSQDTDYSMTDNNPDNDNSSKTEYSTYSNNVSSNDNGGDFDPTTENTTKRNSSWTGNRSPDKKWLKNQNGRYQSNNGSDRNGNNQNDSQRYESNDNTHKSTRSADYYEDQQESPTDSTLQQDDDKTEDTVTYSNGTRYVVTTDGYRVKKRNGTRRLRTRPPGNGTRTRRKRKKKLRRKNSTSTPQSKEGAPPGLPNDYPDYQFPPGFFDDLLNGLNNVSTPFDDGNSSTEDYSDTQMENPPGDIYETTTEGEMKYLPPDQVNDFTVIEPPPNVVCNANESYYRCVPHCKHTCFNYDSDEMCPVFCQPGCGCDQGLLIDEKGQCVPPDDCFELSCGLDEEWWDCMPTCHNTCTNFARAEACEDVECESGCFCRDGLILDSDGNCVEPEECEDPTCHENEEETDCISPCNTCAANCRSCQFRSCREGCDCKDGFKRDSKGECIHASLCPPCTQPSSTLAPSTPE